MSILMPRDRDSRLPGTPASPRLSRETDVALQREHAVGQVRAVQLHEAAHAARTAHIEKTFTDGVKEAADRLKAQGASISDLIVFAVDVETMEIINRMRYER